MVIVNIPLDNETAEIYEKAAQTDKRKMQILLSLWLREFEKPSISLDELMDDVSRKAQERGLTPEILESILNGWSGEVCIWHKCGRQRAIDEEVSSAWCIKQGKGSGDNSFVAWCDWRIARCSQPTPFDRYIDEEDRLKFLSLLIKEATLIEIDETIKECRDPKDDKFLELAVNGNANIIVSGDKDLQVLHPFRNIPILSPREFLDTNL